MAQTVRPAVRDGFLREAGFGAATAQTKELVVRSIDYLDWETSQAVGTGPVMTYRFNSRQGFFTAGSHEASSNLAVPRRVWVSALPRASNAEIATTSYLAAFAVPAAAGDSGTLSTVSQRTTLVPPSFNVRWHLIGYADYTKIFRDTSTQMQAIGTGYNLFTLALLNPDDGNVAGDDIQLRVEVEYAQTLPVLTQISIGRSYGDSFTGSPDSAFGPQVAQVELRRLQDSR